MKINLIIPSFYPATIYGGPIFSTLNTCKELAKLDNVEVYVSTTNANMTSRLDVESNKFIELEKNLFVKYYNETFINKISLPLLFNIWKEIKNSDIIHSQVIYRPMTPIVFLLSKLFNKPIIYSPRGALGIWLLENGNKFKKIWLELFLKPFANTIYWHATSIQEKNEILSLYPKAKVIVIPNGIDYELYQNYNFLSQKELLSKFANYIGEVDKVVVSMGRLQRKKGFDILIDTFSFFIKTYPKAKLLIAGPDEGEKSNLLVQIKQLRLEDSIFLIGSISGQDKVDFLANSDLFVLPSHNENFGNVYLESLASGTPIIASTNTPWEEAEKANCGLWVENTPISTCNAMIEIMKKNPKELSKNAKEYAKSYTWKNIANNFLEKYTFIIKENRK